MAGIHILKGTYQSQQSAIFKQYALHFTLAASSIVAAAADDPDVSAFVSQVPNIAGSELALIQGGSIVERVVTDKYHTWDTPATVLARIRGVYAGLQPVVDENHYRTYQSYLTTKTAS